MKLSAVSSVNPESKINNKDKNISKTSQPYQTNYLSQKKKNSVSFSGSGLALANNVFKYIDKSSFFVEFLIIDTLSMVAPRIAMGLIRDKEQLGHLNWKAAKEEAGREILSGPSMNLIPMGVLFAANKAKPAARMERDYLTYLSETAKSAIGTDAKDVKLTSKQMAEKIFDSNFSSLPQEKESFVELLEKTTEKRGKERKQVVSEFVNKVSELNNKLSSEVVPVHSDNIKYNLDEAVSKELKLKSDSISAGNLVESFGAFKKDIITKINDAKKPNSKEAFELIEKLKSNRSIMKFATAMTAFFAVGIFLKTLPKLYQQKGLSPAQESALRASGKLPKEGGNV